MAEESLDRNELKISVENHDKFRLVRFSGTSRIDLYNCRYLKEVFDEGNQQNIDGWIVDLSSIEYIDSSALSIFGNQGMYLKKKSHKMFILSPTFKIKYLFTTLGFINIFHIIDELP